MGRVLEKCLRMAALWRSQSLNLIWLDPYGWNACRGLLPGVYTVVVLSFNFCVIIIEL